MIVYPIVRWSGCDLCVGYDLERDRFIFWKFRILCHGQVPQGYYRLMFGAVWLFVVDRGVYYFVNRRNGQRVWLGDADLMFSRKNVGFLDKLVVSYGDEWSVVGFEVSRRAGGAADLLWGEVHIDMSDIVAWAQTLQENERRKQASLVGSK